MGKNTPRLSLGSEPESLLQSWEQHFYALEARVLLREGTIYMGDADLDVEKTEEQIH